MHLRSALQLQEMHGHIFCPRNIVMSLFFVFLYDHLLVSQSVNLLVGCGDHFVAYLFMLYACY